MKKFAVMWTGQLFSQLGNALSTFALGIWVYQHTGSVSKFAAVSISWTAALIFMSPLAGAIVDRFDRRSLLILGEVVGAARVLCLSALVAARLRRGADDAAAPQNAPCLRSTTPMVLTSTMMSVHNDQLRT